jgi:hypothetical protein
MNSSRCSKLAAALVVLLLVATVPAAAVSISGDAPDSAEVGEQQTTTFTLTDPFEDYEEWTLQATTELQDVTWRVTTFDNAGNQVAQETMTGQEMSYHLQASNGAVRVEVKLVGTTPATSTFDWSFDPPQQFTYAEFVETQEGGASNTLTTYETRPYTSASQEARTAISDAQDAIEDAKDAGAGVSEAESDLEDAIEFYNGGNFDQATSNAEDAQAAAESAASSAQQTDLLIKVGAGVVVVLALLGGVYWYLQQQDSHDKLG